MDAVRVNVTGDRQVGLLFDQFPDQLHGQLLREVRSLTDDLLGLIESRTPSLTGRLRSEERAKVFDSPERIAGRVSIAGDAKDAAKAGALEYGAHRPTQVKSHSMRLGHVYDNALAEEMTVLVEAYTRTPNIQEIAFERGPLDEMQSVILQRLNAAVDAAVGGANG